jgi:hypothetical protein
MSVQSDYYRQFAEEDDTWAHEREVVCFRAYDTWGPKC